MRASARGTCRSLSVARYRPYFSVIHVVNGHIQASNIASQPQYSPLRYPGGKTWLIPQIRSWLLQRSTTTLLEPFAGGATASLVAILEGIAERAFLVERDPTVVAIWNTVLSANAIWLVDQILSFKFTVQNVKKLLRTQTRSARELAFQTVVKNRAQRGGILAKSARLMKKGERGRGIASRWYPDTLALRIASIHEHRKAFTIIEGDGVMAVSAFALRDPNARFFIDPPYPVEDHPQRGRLYDYNHVDHRELFIALKNVKNDFLMTSALLLRGRCGWIALFSLVRRARLGFQSPTSFFAVIFFTTSGLSPNMVPVSASP